jgi:non-homologous end joining protein Ku
VLNETYLRSARGWIDPYGQLGDPPSLAEEELKLADSLVAKRTCQDFDLARYKDAYAEKLCICVARTRDANLGPIARIQTCTD